MLALPSHIVTSRLVLREPRADDARRIFAAYTRDAEVTRHLTWRPHTGIAESEAFIASCIAAWQGRARFPYVLTLAADEAEPIGMIDARLQGHRVEVGYVLARQYWGRGLMPEAATALTALCLSQRDIFRVQALCDVENIASARTLEKAGFAREARLERYIVHPNVGAEPRACFMYSKCR